MIAVGAILVWIMIAPFAVALIYFAARPFLRLLNQRIRRPSIGESTMS
jgi:hypothetical protein